VIFSGYETFSFTGDFVGTCVGEIRAFILRARGGLLGAKGTAQMLDYFTSTVKGKSSTLMSVTVVFSYPFYECRWVILSGTGELANLRGQGTGSGVCGVVGTYSGWIHFEP